MKPSDIREHLPVLRDLAKNCESVIEIRSREHISTWAILLGLAENNGDFRSYLGISRFAFAKKDLVHIKDLCESIGISCICLHRNDINIDMPYADMLFIDSIHTYCHLTYELELLSSRIEKFIVIHDTSSPWGNADDMEYDGDYSEYPANFDRTKKGLWPAVEDFLLVHPEWNLVERRFNCHGLTILERRILDRS